SSADVSDREERDIQNEQRQGAVAQRVVYADERTQQTDAQSAEGAQSQRGHGKYSKHASADLARRIQLHQRLRHGVESEFEETRGEQQRDGHDVGIRPGETEQ